MPNTRYHPQLGRTIESLTSETRLLLQLLADWSHGDATKPQIYDGYMNMAMAFIACTYAFEEHGVDMSTSRMAPQHIWDQLERMLAMEAAPRTGEIYLPSIQSSAQLLLQDLRAKRRESYQLSRTRKRESLTSNESSTMDTAVEMEREKALLCLSGHGTHRDLGVQCPDVIVLTHRTISEDSSNTKVSESSSCTTLGGVFACDSGEDYVCAACGTACLGPIRDAVDSLTSTSLELKSLLELWRRDPALAVNLYLSCMRVSQDYDAAVEVFANRGTYIADLKPTMDDLKTAVKKAAYFPYRCGHDHLRTQILSDAFGSIDRLNRGLKSRKRRYMLKHAPAISPSITRLLSCLGSLTKILVSWSRGEVGRDRVDYVCAVLEQAFRIVVSAFYARGVDVSNLVPRSSNDLSDVLQSLLAETPSPEIWKKYQHTIGLVFKKILKSVLDLNMDNHTAVEVWWSLILPNDQGNTNGLGDSNPTADSTRFAKPDNIDVMALPRIAPIPIPLGRGFVAKEPVPNVGRMAYGSSPHFDRRRAASLVPQIPTSTLLVDEPAADVPVYPPAARSRHDHDTKAGVIGTTLRRMSGRISSMFNLRDVKDRYKQLAA
ncbi:Bud site selection protein 6 [Ceratobasidium sp. 392]|nr:Bud site selection protein 6 [Ceratobasidium sp. 392]